MSSRKCLEKQHVPVSSAGTPHVTDAFHKATHKIPHLTPVRFCYISTVILFQWLLFAVPLHKLCSTPRKKKFISKPQHFCMTLSLQTKQEQKISANKYILCPVSYSGAVSAVFTADEPVQKDLVQLSCLMPDGRSGPFMDPSILKIQQVTTHLTGIRCLSPARDKHNGKCILLLPLPPGDRQLYKPHLDTAKQKIPRDTNEIPTWKETPTAPYSLKTCFSCWDLLSFLFSALGSLAVFLRGSPAS